MKKFITTFSIALLFIITGNFNKANSQTGYNAVLEHCTGTWCQWCPCDAEIIDGILGNYPNTVVLSYHGGSATDPWIAYSSGMISLFGFSSYPTGVVGRKTGIESNTAWNNHVVLQSLLTQPGVSITVSSKNYDAASRTLSANVAISALTDLNGEYYVSYIITENNLMYYQTGNSTCIANTVLVHDHVVKSVINGSQGELVHSGNWNTGQEVTSNINYVLPVSPQISVPENCELNIFVYKLGSDVRTNSDIQQSMKTPVTGTTGIVNSNSVASTYNLTQNYPNPFNPTTNFSFSLPKDGNVSLKFYDILGNEVSTFVDGFVKSGVYSVEFDGSKLSSGIYFYTLKTDNFVETKRMNLIK